LAWENTVYFVGLMNYWGYIKNDQDICECSFTYNRKNHLITAGRRGGTQFIFKPEIFAELFQIVKHVISKEEKE